MTPFEPYTPLQNLILNALAILFIIIFWGAIYAFFSSVFLFVFSKWDPKKIEKAMNSLKYMILWIILSLIILFIFPFVAQKIKIPGYKIYTAKNIFNRASYLIKNIYNTLSWNYKSNTYPIDDNISPDWSSNIDYELDTSL